MAILLNKETSILVQGLTGREGQFHTEKMIEYGSNVTGGVTPGKGGTETLGVPVFNTVKAAKEKTGATASTIFVPAPFAADAIMEAAEAGIELIVCITEGIPVQDMIKAVKYAKNRGARLIGPNCPGIMAPGEAKMGITPGNIAMRGPVGVISRSGTLTYEIVNDLTQMGIGQSTIIGIGGDPVLGSSFLDILPLFEADPETEIVIMLGEIGGSDEEKAAEYIKTMTKPVIGFISGRSAPPGKRMGHAGAIISGSTGTAKTKVEALTRAGVPVADTVSEVAFMVHHKLNNH
jgi:succinyl-CoA synthetase alpha subunit